MTIWLLALLVVASLAALGYRQGAIRVSFSLLGIFFGVLLALPLGKPFALILKAVGVTQPVLVWLLPPFLAFCVVSALFKAAAQFVHHKIEVYFKYKAGDLRLSLFERLNHRLGLCLGIINGTAYVCLLAFVIYVLSYWTVQMKADTGAHWSINLVNRLGMDLNQSGFSKTARSFDKMPASYYEAADVAGLLYQNSLLEARLARYPAFLMLSERQEFQALATDQVFSEMRMKLAPMNELLQYPQVKAITDNPETLRVIWGVVEPNLKDLRGFLETGVSEKYSDQPLLGRWTFDARGSAAALRKSRPNIAATEMQRSRRSLEALYGRTSLVIGFEGTDNKLVVKELPVLKEGVPPSTQSVQGSWSGSGNNFVLTLSTPEGEVRAPAVLEGSRLSVTLNRSVAVFERED